MADESPDPAATPEALADQILAELHPGFSPPAGAASDMGGPQPQASLLGDFTIAGKGILKAIPRDDLIKLIKLLAGKLLAGRS